MIFYLVVKYILYCFIHMNMAIHIIGGGARGLGSGRDGSPFTRHGRSRPAQAGVGAEKHAQAVLQLMGEPLRDVRRAAPRSVGTRQRPEQRRAQPERVGRGGQAAS